MLTGLLLTLLAAVLGVAGSFLWVRMQNRQRLDAATEEGALIRLRAEAEAEAIRRQAEAEGHAEAHALRQTLELERQSLEDGLTQQEAWLAELGESVSAQAAGVDADQALLAEREEAAKHALERARSIRAEAKATLNKAEQAVETAAEQTRAQCLEQLAASLLDQARAEAADLIRNLESDPGPSTIREAKRVMGIGIGRIDARHTAERQSYNVEITEAQRAALQGDQAFVLEAIQEATGVTCAWINGDDAIRIETGNGVARVEARRALERCLGLRNVQPQNVKAAIVECQKELQSEVLARGTQAFRVLGLKPAHPEIVELVGRLAFRTSYTQNQWEHSVESAYLAGLMAAELGLNVKLARRATLLHDIGKSLTHEVEGSHALIGAEIARRHGEREEVCGAIGEHHDEQPVSTIYTLLVAAADAISGARPGARRELVETYGERIQELEALASGFKGVTLAHAVQAGREVRVLVDEKHVDDQDAEGLAQEIASRISAELTFPGQIRVTVIREFSAVEFAN